MTPGELPGPGRGASQQRPGDILLVEDTRCLAAVYRQYLRAEPWPLRHAETLAEAEASLADHPCDLVLLDLRLPDGDGLDLLRRLTAQAGAPAVVVITAHGSAATAADAMRAGAIDFLLKPFSADRLIVTIANALERRRLRHELAVLRAAGERASFCGFIGAAPAMQAVYRMIENAAASRASVFVTGESGTGKELCAEAVHRLSPRASGPFIAVNCAAIPGASMESEIFGHVGGAVAGAAADRIGAAGQADGGTLFLDEICELDPALQGKLLRFVQTGTFQRVGSTRAERVDVRFVCAADSDPLSAVRAGRFREDLYYRLHAVPIHLPPLRDRGEDVIAIASSFLRQFTCEEGRAFRRFTPEAEAALRAHPWPGNVRELESAIRTTVVLNDGDAVALRMLPTSVLARARIEPPEVPAPGARAGRPAHRGTGGIRPLEAIEREAIEAAIGLCEGNVTRAAAQLGVSPSTLYRKLRRWEGDGRH
ncbi:MAG: sigma-54-dependent Fis family transcriptional regulator [Acetobacteraceae bacterium]|nr:sigma-54-dependent Fis family transcriptional regulator [Acetobacteraceae bacterium]